MCIYIYIYVHVDMYIYIYMDMYIIYIYICSYTHAYIIRISASQYNTKCLSVVPRGSSVQSCLEHVLGYLPEAYILSFCLVTDRV